MATTTLGDQVSSLLGRRLAESRIAGTQPSDIEASAVLETIVTSLVSNPKAILYAYHLARNALSSAVSEEISSIDSLKENIQDLRNRTEKISSTSDLQRAKIALLSVENSGPLRFGSQPLSVYSKSVDSFLNNQLRTNTVRSGKFVRTGAQAALDLPDSIALLKERHDSVLYRLYALESGVRDFTSSGVAQAFTAISATRVRQDIEDILSSLSKDNSGSDSNDLVNRLIAGKAVLSLLSSPNTYDLPAVSTSRSLPAGYSLKAKSPPIPAEITSSLTAYTLPSGASLSIQDESGTVSSQFPCTSIDLNNQAHVLGSPVTYPVSVTGPAYVFIYLRGNPTLGPFVLQPDGTYNLGVDGPWFKDADGRYYRQIRVDINPGTPSDPPVVVASQAQLASLINSAMGTRGACVDFVPGRPLIYADSTTYDRITIAATYCEPVFIPGIADALAYFTASVAPVFGLSHGDSGFSGTTPLATILAAIEYLFPAKASVDAAITPSGTTFKLSGTTTSPGAFLTVSGNAAAPLGLASSAASSNLMTAYGTVFGKTVDPANLTGIVFPGDPVETPTGVSTVSSVSETAITLENSIPTFDGSVTIGNQLYDCWKILAQDVTKFVKSWKTGKYSEGLGSLDSDLAPLSGSPTLAQINKALQSLNDLRAAVSGLLTILTNPSGVPSTLTARPEFSVVEGIVQTLTERGYDRAADYFLSCQIQGLLEMNWQTLSYSGNLMSSATDIVQNDAPFPSPFNRAAIQPSAVNKGRTQL